MKTVDIAGREIHTLDQGSGCPVLLVHGFPLDHSMWQHQIDALAASCRVIAPDLRGFGKSPVEPSAAKAGIAMQAYADDLAQVLDALAVQQPVVYCGFSMGGYIGWQFVRRHREKLCGLVMVDTKANNDTNQAREMRLKMADNVERWGSAHVAKLMSPKMYAKSTPAAKPQVVAEFESIVTRTNPVAIAAAQRGMAERDSSIEILSSIDMPTLYIVGREDEISTPKEMQKMADLTPEARFVEVAEAGHMSPMENPAAVNRALLEFMASVNV